MYRNIQLCEQLSVFSYMLVHASQSFWNEYHPFCQYTELQEDLKQDSLSQYMYLYTCFIVSVLLYVRHFADILYIIIEHLNIYVYEGLQILLLKSMR